MDDSALYEHLTDALLSASSFDELVHPLLQVLQELTGMESVYMTTVDLRAGQQTVVYAHNRGALPLDPGLTVPWSETLCQRALQENTPVCSDVPARWPEAQAAIALGIRSYLSAPVVLADQQLYGTLCAASCESRQVPPAAHKLLRLLALLLAQFLDRERLAQRLLVENAELQDALRTDTLTRLPNRIALHEEIPRRVQRCVRSNQRLMVGFIDLDNFKAINDSYGHAAGDVFLSLQAQRLRQALRPTDYLARVGGDEFVLLAQVPEDEWQEQAVRIAHRMQKASSGIFHLAGQRVNYSGASIGWTGAAGQETDPEHLLAEADAAMYANKQARRSQPIA